MDEQYYTRWDKEKLRNELIVVRNELDIARVRISLLEELEDIIIRVLKLKE